MGSGDILSQIQTFLASINNYFNPVGKFYIQVQVLCRVLVCSVFLDDLFKTSSLECDSKQVGCQQNCINRFAPLNHKKIWELELFMVMLSIVVFLAFSIYNDHKVAGIEKKKNSAVYRDNPDNFQKYKEAKRARYSMEEHTKKGKTFTTSIYTKTGYMVMLLCRLVFELIFLFVENQLGQHQSQNVEFWNRFWLKEQWLCALNDDDKAASNSLMEMIPPVNRSEIFWTDDKNLACIQQKVVATCWIPFSRMKSFGLLFMYWVLIVTTCLTAIELLYELVTICKPKKNKQEPIEYPSQPDIIDTAQVQKLIQDTLRSNAAYAPGSHGSEDNYVNNDTVKYKIQNE